MLARDIMSEVQFILDNPGIEKTPELLEELADRILELDIKNPKKNKSRTTPYPILSKKQQWRRQSKEILFTDLIPSLKRKFGIMEEKADERS